MTTPSYPLPDPGPGLHDKQARKHPFVEEAARALEDSTLRAALNNASVGQNDAMRAAFREVPDPRALRATAAAIKDHALANLDRYLGQLADNVERRGGKVHWALTGQEATRIVGQIAADAGATRLVKAKSMTTEEIRLNHHLEAQGIEVVETDLGELIVQLGDDRPGHIVGPAIHWTKQQIGTLFENKLGMPPTDDPHVMARTARDALREKFRTADMGLIGVNFAVAETGTVVLCTNEGNGRYSVSRPRILGAVMGMEKLIPRMSDLAVFLKLLGRSGTGQRITVYTSLTTGPRADDETDGPEEFHLVILDNGRSRILDSDYAETLRCIRCGACLNACPVYRKVGGHAYGTTYMGPIGKLLTPLYEGLAPFLDLPQASSLCGACLEVCPVAIDMPEMLIRMRADLNRAGHVPWRQRFAMKAWAWTLRRKWTYALVNRIQRFCGRVLAKDGWIGKAPGPVAGWTEARDLPAPARESFRTLWTRRGDDPKPTEEP